MCRVTVSILALTLLAAACGGGSGGGESEGPHFKSASLVVGQPDFFSRESNHGMSSVGPWGFGNVADVAVDDSFTLVADWSHSRILGYVGTIQANDPLADFVIGQDDLTSSDPGLDNDRLHDPRGVALDAGRVFVADTKNSRVLIWNQVSQLGAGANVVVGQPDFYTNTPSSGPQGLNYPHDMLVAGGMLFVSDQLNNRVLVWNPVPTTNHAPASFALGQSDLVGNVAASGASGMNGPGRLWSDGTRLAVCDVGNTRVLIWNTLPTTTGAPADLVLGQPDLDAAGKTLTPDSIRSPNGVAGDGQRLYVTDGVFHRILIYDPFPTTIDPPPTAVLGQSDFAHIAPNDDNQDGVDDGTPTARTLYGPAGLQIHGGRLYVAEFHNFRMLIFNL